jgi:hypothetical protein
MRTCDTLVSAWPTACHAAQIAFGAHTTVTVIPVKPLVPQVTPSHLVTVLEFFSPTDVYLLTTYAPEALTLILFVSVLKLFVCYWIKI